MRMIAYAKFVITKTEVSDIDTVFGKAETPINTLIETRKTVDAGQAEFVSALGLAEGASLDEGLKHIEGLANDKIKLAMEGGSVELATHDDIPEDARAGADALQACLKKMSEATTNLGSVPEDLVILATEAGALTGKIPSLGLPATKIMEVTKQVKENVTALGAAKDEAKALADSLAGFQSAAMASFGASDKEPAEKPHRSSR